MCPVYTIFDPSPHPPVFHEVFILKGVKVVCFDTLSEVFILQDLECTTIVQNEGIFCVVISESFRAEACMNERG